jgi:hypothetical protein
MTADQWQRPLRSRDERMGLGEFDPDVIAGRAIYLAALDYANGRARVLPPVRLAADVDTRRSDDVATVSADVDA